MPSFISENKNTMIDTNEHVLLFEDNGHKIYWMGIEEESAFRCNVYLIEDNDEFIIVDPGSRIYHQELKRRVSNIVDPNKISALILCHQDPDVAASMVDWLEINSSIKIISSSRTNVLLPYYGKSDYEFYNIGDTNSFIFESGRELKFIEAPFLHFPGAFTTLDLTSNMLFSGDIWAALDIDWNLIVDDFDEHIAFMNLFHIDYMPSNVATRGFAKKIEHEKIEAILPQHGSIIDSANVLHAINYLKDLRCGLDIIYADDK
jgi:flavorubredoxin